MPVEDRKEIILYGQTLEKKEIDQTIKKSVVGRKFILNSG